jgi:hypothetical protein
VTAKSRFCKVLHNIFSEKFTDSWLPPQVVDELTDNSLGGILSNIEAVDAVKSIV